MSPQNAIELIRVSDTDREALAGLGDYRLAESAIKFRVEVLAAFEQLLKDDKHAAAGAAPPSGCAPAPNAP